MSLFCVVLSWVYDEPSNTIKILLDDVQIGTDFEPTNKSSVFDAISLRKLNKTLTNTGVYIGKLTITDLTL